MDIDSKLELPDNGFSNERTMKGESIVSPAQYSPLKGHTPIYCGKNSLQNLSVLIEKIHPDRIFILSDTTVFSLHGEVLLSSIPKNITINKIIISSNIF